MNRKLTRRQFLKFITAAASGTIAACARVANVPFVRGYAEESGGKIFLPNLANGTSDTTPSPSPTPSSTPLPPPTGSRVVHVHSPSATSWSGSNIDYWNYVDQAVVDNMVDHGMMTLTGASSVADTWRAILPNYKPGQGIAIKVSFNNSRACGGTDLIDGIIEPVNAVIRGLKSIGVVEPDIWIYDASRAIPNRFKDGCLYNSVQFFASMGGCSPQAGFSSTDSNAYVFFKPPADELNQLSVKITDVLVNASYLINIPIMKHHGAGVSLAIKNHFGSIDHPSDLHSFIGHNTTPDYNASVDLYLNPHIRNKTVLTIGDGIFAAKMNYDPPTLWNTFGNQVPKSLFFGTDPVAIDSVMCDFLDAEKALPDYADDYLSLASSAGLGVFERGNPWGSGYTNIDYLKINL